MENRRAAELHLFVPADGEPRRRRSTDGLVVVAGVGFLVAFGLAAVPASAAEQALIDLTSAAPGFFDVLWQLALATLGLWTAFVVVAALVRGRFGAEVDLVLGAIVGAALWWLVDDVVGPLPGDTRIPVVFAVLCAALTSVRPHLGRPFRRVGRYLVILSAFVLLVMEQTTPSGAVMAVLIGATAAGLTHLALGTSEGRPEVGAVEQTLVELGLPIRSVTAAEQHQAGVFIVDAVKTGGDGDRPIVVRVYGRDSRDTQFLVKAWRSLWYREARAVLPTRIQQAEHEAFVTMLAASCGGRAPAVLAVGRTPAGDALVVFDRIGTALDRIGTALDQVGPDHAEGMWAQLDLLHQAGLALRDVASTRFAVEPSGHIGFADLSTAGLATDDDLLVDRAQLVVATASWIGSGDALAAAKSHLGDERLGAIVPYLQTAALGPELRREVQAAAAPLEIDDLRDQAAQLAGATSPTIAQLRRVSAGALVQLGLMTFAAYAIISLLGGVDLHELASTLAGATWGWVTLALVVGQSAFVTEATSTQGASLRRLAIGPLVTLQVAIGFVKLAVPSTAARVAMILRYFQKQGVPAPVATSISALETFSGFLVQIALLLVILVFELGSVHLEAPTGSSTSSGNLAIALGALLVLAVILAAVVAVVPSLRHRLVDRIRPWLGDARDALHVLRSPVRLLELFGGNLATQVIYALALAACVEAFGADVNLAAALVVYVIASLFGGIMPVPGGIGVMEAAVTVGLVAVGVPESVALASAIMFRIVTFYLPPLWGWFALHWLEKKRYL